MNKDWRKMADYEARQYRKYRAYARGYEQEMTAETPVSPRYTHCSNWAWAVERVRAMLSVYEPDVERFFAYYYELDAPLPRNLTPGGAAIRAGMKLHVSRSVIYKWRERVLDALILAATQAGAMQPYTEEAGRVSRASDEQPASARYDAQEA